MDTDYKSDGIRICSPPEKNHRRGRDLKLPARPLPGYREKGTRKMSWGRKLFWLGGRKRNKSREGFIMQEKYRSRSRGKSLLIGGRWRLTEGSEHLRCRRPWLRKLSEGEKKEPW